MGAHRLSRLLLNCECRGYYSTSVVLGLLLYRLRCEHHHRSGGAPMRLLPLALAAWVLASGERAEGACGVWEYTPQYTPLRCTACPGEECPAVECLEHGGLQRCWRKFVPSRLSSPVRVLFDMHGYSSNMDVSQELKNKKIELCALVRHFKRSWSNSSTALNS